MAWTDAQIADLKRLWAAGHSTSQIGTILGVSRNAVIGKAHRLKLPARPSPIRHSSEPKKAKLAPLPKQVRKIQRRPIIQPGPQRNGSPSCLWPIGNPGDADFRFCGGETVRGRPYCFEHCARAYLRRSTDRFQAA